MNFEKVAEKLESQKTEERKEKNLSKLNIFLIVFVGILISSTLIVLGILSFVRGQSFRSRSRSLVSSGPVNGEILFLKGCQEKEQRDLFSISQDRKQIELISENFFGDKINRLIYFPSVSLDGKKLVFVCDKSIYIRSLKGKDNFEMIFETENLDIIAPFFSSDGKTIIFGGCKKKKADKDLSKGITFYRIDADSNAKILKRITMFSREIFSNVIDFKYTPDEKYIVCFVTLKSDNQQKPKLYVIDVNDLEEEKEENDENENDNEQGWNDLNLNDEGNSKGLINLVYEDSDEFEIAIYSLSISPNGSKIAFLVKKHSIISNLEKYKIREKYEIRIVNLDGNGLELIYENNDGFFPPLWSPDGEYVLFTEFCAEGTMKTIKIDSVANDGKYAVEELRDKDNKPIEGFPLHWAAK